MKIASGGNGKHKVGNYFHESCESVCSESEGIARKPSQFNWTLFWVIPELQVLETTAIKQSTNQPTDQEISKETNQEKTNQPSDQTSKEPTKKPTNQETTKGTNLLAVIKSLFTYPEDQPA